MSSTLEKLNLRPQERRLLVGIFVVIFIVLNVLLVWPRFGDWAKVRASLDKTQMNLITYRSKIAQVSGRNGLEAKLKKLEGEGESVVLEEQDVQMLRAVQSQVAQSKVTVSNYGEIKKQTSGKTNEFFEEQSIQISVNTGEKELVDFLLNIGSGSSMIRVRDLDLKPADQNRYRLQGRITLSANYQKKPTARAAKAAAAATLKPPAPGVKKP
ncbi:MAG: hypothetical protein ABIQ35_01240 [Verrucomicrobiota bacterium]